jgi:hypothetical protein
MNFSATETELELTKVIHLLITFPAIIISKLTNSIGFESKRSSEMKSNRMYWTDSIVQINLATIKRGKPCTSSSMQFVTSYNLMHGEQYSQSDRKPLQIRPCQLPQLPVAQLALAYLHDGFLRVSYGPVHVRQEINYVSAHIKLLSSPCGVLLTD